MLEPDACLLTDRVAVVTGAAAGIGRAIALTFARFGAHLALCDREAAQRAETARAVEPARGRGERGRRRGAGGDYEL